MNDKIAPKSIVIEVADPIPLRGRQKLKMRHGECVELLPGFVPPACNQGVPWEQGRSVGLRPWPVGSDKLIQRGRSEGLTEVRLPVSTPRTGEPATWGSGQRKLNCSWET